jgi:hypothetical protein
MKTETVFVQVPYSEHPKEPDYYFTEKGLLLFEDGIWSNGDGTTFVPNWWLEKREEQVVMSKEEYKELMNNMLSAINPI